LQTHQMGLRSRKARLSGPLTMKKGHSTVKAKQKLRTLWGFTLSDWVFAIFVAVLTVILLLIGLK
jgi:hypothetical protein